jgi:hypothetical protein
LLGGVLEPRPPGLDLSTWWVHLLGPALGATVAVAVAHVLHGPAKAQDAIAAKGMPIDRTR